MQVVSREGDWVKVTFRDTHLGDRTGYVRAADLTSAPTPPTASQSTTASAPEPTPTPSVARAPADPAPPPPTKSAPTTPGPSTLATPVASATSSPLVLRKGESVALKVPLGALRYDASSFTGAMILVGGVRASTAHTFSVENDLDWQTAGFPPLLTFKVEKSSKKQEYTEVELRSVGIYVKLRFDPTVPDVGVALGSLLIRGEADGPAAAAYSQQAYRNLAGRFFTGKLAELSESQQAALVRFAHLKARGLTMRSEVYKDSSYVVVDLGKDTSVYNDLRFNQATLLAHVFNEHLLAIVKSFAEPARGASAVGGLKLVFEIPHKSFLQEYAPSSLYKLEIFTPTKQVLAFADADITNQELVDASVVLVDGNRVKVSLAVGQD